MTLCFISDFAIKEIGIIYDTVFFRLTQLEIKILDPHYKVEYEYLIMIVPSEYFYVALIRFF